MDEKRQYSVLIVDDDVSDLNALYNILKASYTVYFAKSGEAAVRRAAENRPDIILLDVVMPELNGYEVIAELKKSSLTCDIPIIFITALDEVEDELTGFDLGAVDYITKPFHGAIVNARIKSHLKTLRRLGAEDNAGFLLKSRRTARKVAFRELMYVDVAGHKINFHLLGGEVAAVYAPLKEYAAELLTEPRFARCHTSFLVNMDFVEAVGVHEVTMKSGEILPISQRYAGFKIRYVEWIKGE